MTEKVPKLPLLAKGQYVHPGWEIPTVWAVDADKQAWMDNAHGHALCPVPVDVLLEAIGHPEGLRKLLGFKPKLPEWMRYALHNKWKPPEGWRREDYE